MTKVATTTELLALPLQQQFGPPNSRSCRAAKLVWEAQKLVACQ